METLWHIKVLKSESQVDEDSDEGGKHKETGEV